MRNIVVIAVHDLRQTFTDRSAMLWMLVLPVVFAVFIGFVTGGGGGQDDPTDDRAYLTIVDLDGGSLARMLIDELESDRLSLNEIGPEALDNDERKVRILTIPAGFTDSVLNGEQVTLRIDKEPGTSEPAALVAQARTVAAISRVVASLIEVAGAAGVDAKLTAEQFDGYASPDDLVTVESRFAGGSTVAPSGFTQSVPGNTVMFVMLVALTYGSASLAGEREGGLLRRLATAPVSRAELILGKIGGRFFIAWVQVTALVAVGAILMPVFGFSLGDNLFGVYLVLLVYAIAVAPLGVLLGAWFKEPNHAANVGVLLTMLMAALGGCWWPIEVVSRPLQRLALVFPTGWAMHALHQLIAFGREFHEIGAPLLVLLFYGVVFSIAGARLLRV
jgi:ABC-type multidrug transport system permease subunit